MRLSLGYTKLIGMLALVVFVAGLLAACDDERTDAADKEQKKQGQVYEGLAAGQPAQGMSYSPSRESANKWADKWDEQGKVSYVYILDSVGNKLGYFIFKGLPVSYCASLTPPDQVDHIDYGSVDAVVRAAPALDGMYYSAANCQQMYGFDAMTGQYYEFTGGGAFGYFLSDQPITGLDMDPLGDATIEEAKQAN